MPKLDGVHDKSLIKKNSNGSESIMKFLRSAPTVNENG